MKKAFSILFVTMVSLALAAGIISAKPMVDSIHFLIPGGAGGGWDGTARGTGEALTKSGLLGKATYENMSGGGGGKATTEGEHPISPGSAIKSVDQGPWPPCARHEGAPSRRMRTRAGGAAREPAQSRGLAEDGAAASQGGGRGG